MLRWLYKSYRFSASIKLWLRQKFTPAGTIVLVATLIAAGIGVDTTQAMAYQISTLLWMFLLFSVVWSIFKAPRFVARRILPRVGTAGQPLHYRILVTNPGKRVQSAVAISEDLGDGLPTYPEFSSKPEPGEFKRNLFDRFFRFYRWMWLISLKEIAAAAPHPIPTLNPGQSVEIAAQLLPRKRGRLNLEGFRFSVPDPFGISKRHSRQRLPEHIIILPKRYLLPRIELGGTMLYQPGGLSLGNSIGNSEEFMSVREYRRGDPLRHIHWKSTSKTGKLIVKEFQNEFFARHALILDTFLDDVSRSAVFEEAVSIAASFACSLDSQDSMLDLVFVGPQACSVSGNGHGHLEQVLELLATVQPCTEKAFEELEQVVLRETAAVSGCLAVFLDWDQKRKELVDHLASARIPVLVIVVHDPRKAIPSTPLPTEEIIQFHYITLGKVEEGLAQL